MNKTEIGIGGLLILLIFGFSGLVIGNSFTKTQTPPPSLPMPTTIQPTASNDRGLQLQVIKVTSGPTPVPGCLADNPLSDATNCECPNIDVKNTRGTYTPIQEPKCTLTDCVWHQLCQTTPGCENNAEQCWVTYKGLQTAIGCDQSVYQQQLADGKPHCIGKPVIYLYPEKPSLISVHLQIPGQIIQSIPSYPQNGWQNIFAQPSGELTYQGGHYHELFYESSVSTFTAPTNGVIIPSNQLKETLDIEITKLGLLANERSEFLAYWLPRLQNLHAPYILFSVFSPQDKKAIDHVTISPRPDTRIEFLAYFKPLWQPTMIDPLLLPSVPQRQGFTEVEWGGTIDQ